MAEQTVLEKTKISAASDVQTVSERTEKVPEYILNPKKEKNYGVELLRIVSMLFIVVLHVINFGGISYHHSGMYFGLTAENMAHYKVMNIILAFCYCAVNCYALISGYVGCKSKFRISKLISLWVTVVSINAIIYGITYAFSPEIAASYDIMRIFTPLTNDQYWYFTAYMGLLVIMPALNAAVNNIPKKQFGYMLIGCFLFFVLFPSSINKDLFYTHTGYSMLWLCLLYIVGGYLKKYDILAHIRPLWGLLTYIAMVLITLVLKCNEYAHFVEYTSPTIFIAGLGLFAFFANLKINSAFLKKTIAVLSPATLGVYIIHVNQLVFWRLLADSTTPFLQHKTVVMVAFVLLTALGIYVSCTLIDLIRIFIFKKIGIKEKTARLDSLWDN